MARVPGESLRSSLLASLVEGCAGHGAALLARRAHLSRWHKTSGGPSNGSLSLAGVVQNLGWRVAELVLPSPAAGDR